MNKILPFICSILMSISLGGTEKPTCLEIAQNEILIVDEYSSHLDLSSSINIEGTLFSNDEITLRSAKEIKCGLESHIEAMTLNVFLQDDVILNETDDPEAFFELPPVSPTEFTGKFKTARFINEHNYKLNSEWLPSSSSDVIYYRVYNNEKLVFQVSSNGPFTYSTVLKAKRDYKGFKVVSVNTSGLESTPTPLTIK